MKKGFTLIELLGVIVILGIIGMITVPIIQGTITDSRNKAYQDQVASVEKAARNYVASDLYNITSQCEASTTHKTTVTLDILQQKGFLESGDIKNPNTDKYIDLSTSTVAITYTNNQFKYSVSLIDKN
jgi:prepilin-type N-terminal cleavage/methylation domain-containing protein